MRGALTFRRKLVRIGGSTVVALPRKARKRLGLHVGNTVRLVVDEECVIIARERGMMDGSVDIQDKAT